MHREIKETILKIPTEVTTTLECGEAKDLLYLFVCNELDEAETEEVIRHLARCEECRLALVEHAQLAKHVGKALKELPIEFKSINA